MQVDILARIAAQADTVLRALLDQSLDCIKLISLTGEVEYMNHNGLAAMEICDETQVLGAQWVDFWPADTAPKVVAALDAAGGGETTRFEGFCPTMSGSPRWWHVAVSPVRGDDGEITHFLAASRDISDLVTQREEIAGRLREAEEAVAYEGAKAGEMRHRMKNLLTVVSSLVKFQSRAASSVQDLAQKVDARLRALGRAQDLIAARRTLPEAGLLREVTRLLDDIGAVEAISVDCSADRPVCDQAIETISLILSELQTNAMKHGALADPEGRVDLRLSLHEADFIGLDWQETAARPIAAPVDGGNGLVLLKRMGSAAGPAQFDWLPTGLHARMTVRA